MCVCVCVYREPWSGRLGAASVSAAEPLPSAELPCTWSRTTTTEETRPESLVKCDTIGEKKLLGHGSKFDGHSSSVGQVYFLVEDVKL